MIGKLLITAVAVLGFAANSQAQVFFSAQGGAVADAISGGVVTGCAAVKFGSAQLSCDTIGAAILRDNGDIITSVSNNALGVGTGGLFGSVRGEGVAIAGGGQPTHTSCVGGVFGNGQLSCSGRSSTSATGNRAAFSLFAR